MADIREEAEFHLIQFLFLLCILFHLAYLELISFPALHGIEYK